jgi:alanine dehydrogenase
LAPDPVQAKVLLEKKVVGIAYETITDSKGALPLLTPMSEIAGRIAIQAGACHLQMDKGGKGVLLGGVPGVHPAHVVIIGGGVVGTEAARMAMGLGASVRILDTSLERLRALDARWGPNLKTLFSTPYEIEKCAEEADLLISSVLIPGKRAPKIVTRSMLRKMEPGSVFVDVAIDQGGSSETSRPTTHASPTYVEEGVIHYCVTNMPGASARTSTLALTNATNRYLLTLANLGVRQALKEDPGLRNGLNVCHGHVTHEAVAHDLNRPFVSPSDVI